MKKIKDFIMRRPWLRLIALGVRSLMRDGLAKTWKKVTRTVRIMKSNVRKYTEAELNKQRTVEFPRQVRFSILVPLYNTPEVFLREMIRSGTDLCQLGALPCRRQRAGVCICRSNMQGICKRRQPHSI